MTRIGMVFLALLLFFATNGAAAEQRDTFPDVSAINASRSGLAQTIRFLDENPRLLTLPAQAVPAPADRRALRMAWQSFLDHIIALDVIGGRNERRYRGEGRTADAFAASFAAFLAQYRYALEFLKRSERSEAAHAILNEAVPELGLPAGTYARVKFRFLNVLAAAEFSRLALVYRTITPPTPLAASIEQDMGYVLKLDDHQGPALTAKNAARVVQDSALALWFPVQKGVAEWMGDTKVLRPDLSLISAGQLAELQPRLEPGDIILVRREWYLSNIGLPGYWPHAALYVGTAEERRAYFTEASVQAWVRAQGEGSGELEDLLASEKDANYNESSKSPQGEPIRVIEAISEGVSFTSLEHAGGGDSLVVLRPRRDKRVKARAILRAFRLAGRPYDFDFNFLTDSALVCTELVYKAYEGDEGLRLPLESVLGRPVLPANRIARIFDEEFDAPQRQFDFVAFLDGNEFSGTAVAADVQAFRQSWRRPKWHILTEPAR